MVGKNRASKRLYYSIGEVCEMLSLEPHVLRYWENEFRLLKPGKNRAGKRIYREKDIKIVRLIKYLVYEEGYTIEGADRKLRRMMQNANSGPQTEFLFDTPSPENLLRQIREELIEIRAFLEPPHEADKKSSHK
jgi:DNA-binding transcriptional MerR regulator